jgi:ZIP family zinc transporter
MELLYVLGGTGFIFLATCLGAATVVFFKQQSDGRAQKVFLGFAAGVMIAAAVWSLLIPAIESAEESGTPGWFPAAIGFAVGALFLFLLDEAVPHLHPSTGVIEGAPSTFKRSALLVSAVTLHNIPEGMAVGLSFALALQRPENPELFASAIALSLGIGIQNFPEGAAISLPLRQEGVSAKKAFLMGCASGAVEPIFGIATALMAVWIAPAMPFLLSFAAGAMIYVVVEELIPEANLGEHSHIGTFGVLAGFLIMMILDVALG